MFYFVLVEKFRLKINLFCLLIVDSVTMFQAKKFPQASMVPHKSQGGAEQLANVGVSAVKDVAPAGGSGKQRLRWTSDLHDRFVDAITQLGGPDSGYFFSY